MVVNLVDAESTNKHVIFVCFLFILIIKTIVIIIIIFTIMCDDEKTEEGGFNKLFARLRFLLRPFLICTILVSDDHHDGDHHYHVHDDDDDDNGKVYTKLFAIGTSKLYR